MSEKRTSSRTATKETAPRAWQRMLSGRRLDLLDPSPLDIEIEDIAHGLAEGVAFPQDRDPRQAGLKPVQNEFFKQRAAVAFRAAPFIVVIGDVKRVASRPWAARPPIGMRQRLVSPACRLWALFGQILCVRA